MVTCLWSATTGLVDSRSLNKPGDERDVSAFMEDCRVNALSPGFFRAPCPRDAAEIRYVADQAFDRHAARRPIVTVETLRQLQQLLDRVRAPLRNQAVPPAGERDQRDQIGS